VLLRLRATLSSMALSLTRRCSPSSRRLPPLSNRRRIAPLSLLVSAAPHTIRASSCRFASMATQPPPSSTVPECEPSQGAAISTGSVDDNFEKYILPENEDRRLTHYLITGASRFMYASAARLMVIRLVASLSASADVLALGSLEVPLSNIAEGSTMTVKWRGKPVFIRHRSAAEIEEARQTAQSELKDPQPDEDRAQKPEWLVVLGVCTHLGCVPISNAGEYSGWFCPCHGSHYDTSGRIRKGPAPLNLEVPQYRFITDDKIMLG